MPACGQFKAPMRSARQEHSTQAAAPRCLKHASGNQSPHDWQMVNLQLNRAYKALWLFICLELHCHRPRGNACSTVAPLD